MESSFRFGGRNDFISRPNHRKTNTTPRYHNEIIVSAFAGSSRTSLRTKLSARFRQLCHGTFNVIIFARKRTRYIITTTYVFSPHTRSYAYVVFVVLLKTFFFFYLFFSLSTNPDRFDIKRRLFCTKLFAD